jgi:chromosome segregation ATPase
VSASYTLPDLQRDLRQVQQHIQDLNRQLDELPASVRFDQAEGLQQRLQHYETQRDRLQARIQAAAHA